MANYLSVGLLLIVAGLLFFLVGAGLFGVSYLTVVLPILFFVVGIGFVVLDFVYARHKE